MNNTSAFYGQLNAIHGRVSLKQGAKIYRAKHGVESYDGGIVESIDIDNNSLSLGLGPQFINCKEGIYIENYTISDYSANRINGVSFLLDSYLAFGGTDYQNFFGMFIYSARGTYVGGCKFLNNDANQYHGDYRGIGIFMKNPTINSIAISEAANVFYTDTKTGCVIAKVHYTTTPSTYRGSFQKLSVGLYGVITDKADINQIDFANNFNDVNIVGTTYFNIAQNTFSANQSTLSGLFLSFGGFYKFMSQIYIRQPERLIIYDNNFTRNNTSNLVSKYPSIYIEDATGKKILIHKNNFEGDNTGSPVMPSDNAILADGNLSNFEWVCNKFNNFTYDVIYYGTGPSTVPTFGYVAGNVYSPLATTNIINNSGQILTYITNNIPAPTYNAFTVNIINDPSSRTWESGDCDLTCSLVETIIKNEVLSVHEAKAGSINIYPNPSNTVLNVNFNNLNYNTIEVELYNSIGTKVISKSFDNTTGQLDVSQLNNGIYFIKYTIDNKLYQSKIVVKH